MHPDSQLRRAGQFVKVFCIAEFYGNMRRVANVIDRRAGVLEQRVAHLMCVKILQSFGLEVEVEGAENVKGLEQRYCIVSNHISYLDFVVHLAHDPKTPVFIAKKEVTWYPVVGPYLQSRGILIDRKAGIGARKAISAATEADVAWPILIFAEGTRSRDGELKEFRPGGISVIAGTGMPLVPMCILGSHEAFPPGKPTVRPNKRMKLIIGKPVESKGRDPADLIDELHAWMKATYDGRRHEILDGAPARQVVGAPSPSQ
jgi:1-acyl-sn-glycerol-3-phosphate acyltransferase